MNKTSKYRQQEKITRLIARYIADKCIRNNTPLESLHAKITDPEMRELMLAIEKNLNLELHPILHWKAYPIGASKNPNYPYKWIKWDRFYEIIEKNYFGEYGVSWDIPEKKWKELTIDKDK